MTFLMFTMILNLLIGQWYVLSCGYATKLWLLLLYMQYIPMLKKLHPAHMITLLYSIVTYSVQWNEERQLKMAMKNVIYQFKDRFHLRA